MEGCEEFCRYIPTGQYGRLYCVNSSHGRGKTFEIVLLPPGEAPLLNGSSNPPLNRNGVTVFGVISGNPGWDETYGWLHEGPWQQEIQRVYDYFVELERKMNEEREKEDRRKAEELKRRQAETLASYTPEWKPYEGE